MTRAAILDAIERERFAQIRKWGDQSHLPDIDTTPVPFARSAMPYIRRWAEGNSKCFAAILIEEVCEAIEECGNDAPEASERLRAELVQVAAVAVQWIEAIDKKTKETTT